MVTFDSARLLEGHSTRADPYSLPIMDMVMVAVHCPQGHGQPSALIPLDDWYINHASPKSIQITITSM